MSEEFDVEKAMDSVKHLETDIPPDITIECVVNHKAKYPNKLECKIITSPYLDSILDK